MPASGFYEWLPTEQLGRSGKPLKQPFYLHRKNDQPLALAGIYEFWRDDSKPDDAEDAWVISYSIITTTATDDVGRVHDRMPMAVDEDNWPAWLDPGTAADKAKALMGSPTHRHPGHLRHHHGRQRRQEQRSRTARSATGRLRAESGSRKVVER